MESELIILDGINLTPLIWFKFLENRNRTTHVYDEIDAEAIYKNLPDFKRETSQLLETLKNL